MVSDSLQRTPQSAEPEEQFDLSDFWKLFLAHFWFVLIVAVFFCAGSFFYYSAQPDRYEATTVIAFEDPPQKAYMDALGYRNFLNVPQRNDTFYNVQLGFLESEPVFSKTVDRIPELKVQSRYKLEQLKKSNIAIGFDRRIEAIRVRVNYPDPIVAAKIANTIVDVYVEERNLEVIVKVQEFVDKVLKGGAEDQDAFRAVNNLLNLQESDLNMLNRQRGELQGQLNSLLLSYKEGHPRVMAIREQLEATGKELDKKIAIVFKNWKDNFEPKYFTPLIRILQYARPPQKPAGPQRVSGVFLWTILGAAVGFGFVYLLDRSNPRIRSEEEFITLTDSVSLGILPKFGKSDFLNHFRKASQAVQDAVACIRTAVLFSIPSNKPYVLLLTSILPLEGKTTVAANLAASFAESGTKTLIIDADIRRPKLHQLFSVIRTPGLTNVLKRDAALEEAIRPTAVENLSIISAGDTVHNPAEILGIEHMASLIESLKGRFNKIIVDSPALLNVADGLILSPVANGVIFVVNGEKTDKKLLRRAVYKMRQSNVNILGGIINRQKISHSHYSYSS